MQAPESSADGDPFAFMRHPDQMCEMVRRVRDLSHKARLIVQNCRLAKHNGFQALGTGKSNFCQRCLVASRVVLYEIEKELARVAACDHEVKC